MEIEIFDPEMCCSTGICGPSPDPELIRVGELVETLKNQGHSVQRYMLSRNPQAFSANPKVYQTLLKDGPKALPILVVEGEVRLAGKYPELRDFELPEE
ncbi:arsenite efflux transporter metallochaperone ArsD [Fodinisporobacter ferrooxydans]|uniref:Arsenite efflux transporter metallochaperone ArsD n=1 Tax=Fodinisporobacter ferrooxydans TaxID=2901836 RepID=A0ABY4CIA2_9BACL|nr:arsenite efflux transporter metallochaperone ArsD [Alicyclobacillaceae bacterium MYW30-H2]